MRDLTHDGTWSTYDVSLLKLSNVSFQGKWTRMGNTLNIPSPTKLARLGHFRPASQAGRLAGPVFYVFLCICLFSVSWQCSCLGWIWSFYQCTVPVRPNAQMPNCMPTTSRRYGTTGAFSKIMVDMLHEGILYRSQYQCCWPRIFFPGPNFNNDRVIHYYMADLLIVEKLNMPVSWKFCLNS